MSYEVSFADILALGDNDEEDPVFEIGTKKKSKYTKTQSDVFKVSDEPSLPGDCQWILQSTPNVVQQLILFIQASETKKKLMNDLNVQENGKKTKRTRKNKNYRKHLGMSLSPYNNIVVLILKNIGSAEIVEEIKIVAGAQDQVFLDMAHTMAHVTYADAEEAKAGDAFIVKYNECKKAQDFANQSVMEDIVEERYYGNTEYKLKLTHTSTERILRLTTQMKFRIQEGNGEAFYMIGVGDNGEATGISTEEMEVSLRILHKMAMTLKVQILVRSVNKGRKGEIVKVMVM